MGTVVKFNVSKTMRYWHDCTDAQKLERWINVLRVLRGLTRHQRQKHWDMRSYGQVTECGTVCCAAGFCGLDSWFRRRGWKMDIRYAYTEEMSGKRIYYDELSCDPHDFFGFEGCENIFYRYERRTVGDVIKEVIAHLRWLKGGAKGFAPALAMKHHNAHVERQRNAART